MKKQIKHHGIGKNIVTNEYFDLNKQNYWFRSNDFIN